MDRNLRKQLLFITIGILVLFPILINGLMFFNILPVKGNIDTWISTLGTFWGAIIGGVISGILTLIGVNITILRQDKKEIIKSYPERRKLGDDITLVTTETSRVLQYHIERKDWVEIYEYTEDLMLKRDELLTKASKVSDEVYEELRSKFYVYVRNFMFDVQTNPRDIKKIESYKEYFHDQSLKIYSLVDNVTEEYRRIKGK
ncbi:hypothetical protein ACQRXC_03855 [Niallia taxi]|uniref:hypothetical protein n=1 Tax=Niallia taxi TaxID=2499688 RepID=UPI003F60E7F3